VFNPEQGLWLTVVNRKCLFAGLAAVAVATASFTELDGFNASTVWAMSVVFFLA